MAWWTPIKPKSKTNKTYTKERVETVEESDDRTDII